LEVESQIIHRKRAFCISPKCRSLENFYYKRNSENDRYGGVLTHMIGNFVALCEYIQRRGALFLVYLYNGIPEPDTW